MIESNELIMNQNTENFINNARFDELYEQLAKTHKPIKAKLAEENLEAIGLVIVKFQRLEHTVQVLMGFLLNIQDHQELNRILAAKMSFKNLLLVVLALSKEVGFHRYTDLEFLINRAMTAEEIRNQIIHSIWTSGPRIKTDLDNKKGLVTKFEEYSLDELMAIAGRVDQLDTALSSITWDYLEYSSEHGTQLKGYLVVGP